MRLVAAVSSIVEVVVLLLNVFCEPSANWIKHRSHVKFGKKTQKEIQYSERGSDSPSLCKSLQVLQTINKIGVLNV